MKRVGNNYREESFLILRHPPEKKILYQSLTYHVNMYMYVCTVHQIHSGTSQ